MQLLRRQAIKKNINLLVYFVQINEFEEEDGELKSPMIETDENRVMQVLLSISTNAVKFT
jgi:hypothetical protein